MRVNRRLAEQLRQAFLEALLELRDHRGRGGFECFGLFGDGLGAFADVGGDAGAFSSALFVEGGEGFDQGGFEKGFNLFAALFGPLLIGAAENAGDAQQGH